MNFIALDVETANPDLSSICQIGLAVYRDGQLADEWKTYVDPRDDFSAFNISIHGIDERTVRGAPTFADIAPALVNRLRSEIVATHTAFDRAAIYRAAIRWSAPTPTCKWLDTACVVRRAWEEFSRSGYGLQNVCSHLGYSYQAHDALEDAKAAGAVLLAAIARSGLSLADWLVRSHQPIDPAHSDRITRDGNPDGPLSGEVLVFTGALSMPRREAADLAARAGCEVDAGVTKRTSLLVVGDQDIRHLAGHEVSSKQRKAEQLMAKGQAIRVIGESDFQELVSIVTYRGGEPEN